MSIEKLFFTSGDSNPRSIHDIVFHTLMFGISLAILGCSRGPGRVEPPPISASDAGAEAVAMYDANGDGKISGVELDKCPALRAAVARIDKTGEGAITADMITERIEDWQRSRLGRIPLTCTVLRNGRPLANAEVRFVPAEFLGPNVRPAKGRTGPNGAATINIETTNRSVPPGVAPGLYSVEITKVGENIPAKYNTSTTLGQEVASDAVGIREGIKFMLFY